MEKIKLNSKELNLYNYATSELSQDAFILWLLAWANPIEELSGDQLNLHVAAISFVRGLLGKTNLEIDSIECIKQKDNIDVLAIINNNIALIIEDKTYTKEHKQLERYSETVKAKYHSCSELHCVYYKSGNESFNSIDKVKRRYNEYIKNSAGQLKVFFKIMLREDILRLLRSIEKPVINNIFVDYVAHLDRLQGWSDSYKKGKIAGLWGNTAWQGFYMALEKVINAELNKDKQEEESKIYCKWDSEPKGKKRKNKKKKEISVWYLQLPKLSIIDDGSICLYLYLKIDELSIKAYCKDARYPHTGWSNILGKLAEIEVDGLNVIPNECVRNKGENVTLCKIKQEKSEFIDEDSSYTDLNKVASLLLKLHKQLSVIASKQRQK